jgi:hypothetical protein
MKNSKHSGGLTAEEQKRVQEAEGQGASPDQAVATVKLAEELGVLGPDGSLIKG